MIPRNLHSNPDFIVWAFLAAPDRYTCWGTCPEKYTAFDILIFSKIAACDGGIEAKGHAPLLEHLLVSLINTTCWARFPKEQCKLWVYKKFSGINGQLVANPGYVCPRYRTKAQPTDGRPIIQVNADDAMLNADVTSCYLSDILCTGRSCGRAIADRRCVKFQKCLHILTTRYLLP